MMSISKQTCARSPTSFLSPRSAQMRFSRIVCASNRSGIKTPPFIRGAFLHSIQRFSVECQQIVEHSFLFCNILGLVGAFLRGVRSAGRGARVPCSPPSRPPRRCAPHGAVSGPSHGSALPPYFRLLSQAIPVYHALRACQGQSKSRTARPLTCSDCAVHRARPERGGRKEVQG